MSIEVSEHVQTLRYARENWIPRDIDGRMVNPSTMHRWIHKGLAGLHGDRIRLEVLYRGQTPCTTMEAVQRFFQAITHARIERAKQSSQQMTDVTPAELRAAGLL